MYNKLFIFCVCVCMAMFSAAAQDLYVNSATGKNSNDGSKGNPFKNIQKAADVAADGATIHVAEGNYFGNLDNGSITVTKPVKIIGGYSSDFSARDVLKYLTMVQPSQATTATSSKPTFSITVKKPGTEVVVDGLIFDRGNAIAYSAKGEGKPEGVESPKMVDGTPLEGVGGPNLDIPKSKYKDLAMFSVGNATCDITIQNCAFINAPYYGVSGTFQGKKIVINNCVFINCRMAAVEVPGGLPKEDPDFYFTNNTVLFSWSRTDRKSTRLNSSHT